MRVPFYTDSQPIITILNAINGSKVAVVSQQTALTISAIYTCNKIICDTTSLIPAKIFKYTSKGKELDPEHDQWELLTKKVNPYTSYLQFDRRWTTDFNIWGNGYAEIVRAAGRPIEYYNLLPYEVEPVIKDGVKSYIYTPKKGAKRVIMAENMLHLSNTDVDGNGLGMSPIMQNYNTINYGLSIDAYSDDMYKNGVQLSGYIYGETALDPAGREELRRNFENKFKDKTGQVGILPRGFKYEPLSYNLPMADAAIIEAKKLSIQDIGRIYGVPNTMLGLSEHADNKGESSYNQFLATTIAPITLLKASELNNKIFRTIEKTHYVKYELNGLYRTSLKERHEAHRIAITTGYMNYDEVREIEDLPPIPNGMGKIYSRQVNTMPAEVWAEYYKNQNPKDGNSKVI